ncbi:MAG: hypothetical protein ABI927_02090 [Gaiellaceae bacterium]
MPDVTLIPEDDLTRFMTSQTWVRSRTGVPSSARVLEAVLVRGDAPLLALTLVEVDIEHGMSEIYQLPIGLRPAADGWNERVIAQFDGWTAYDALADPVLVRTLEARVTDRESIQAGDASVEFAAIVADEPPTPRSPGDEVTLRVYRRLDAGTHPELELLRFLTEHDFPNVAPLVGSYSYASPVIDATLGVAQRRLPVDLDGWSFALASMTDSPEPFLEAVRQLGTVTRSMHELLASEPTDADFASEEPSAEALALFYATLDEEIGTVFANLPGDEALAPISGRGEEVRDELRSMSRLPRGGRVIRIHGNYHLGNVAWTGSDWLIGDFAGDLERTMPERRRKQSPLRDVATMLSSFRYVASAAALEIGHEPPLGWEEHVRSEFLSGYFAQVETAGIVPGGAEEVESLLILFELERTVHELRYEILYRPDWVSIPVSGIRRLLDLRSCLVV